MIIETKFQEGDTVWFIQNAKAINNIVRGIRIERRQLKPSYEIVQETIYLCNNDEKAVAFIKVDEKVAYPTKEELLQSL